MEAVFEATARILQADGVAGLNTNAIAKLAGISIGTLYQYFPDKKAILIALARRELDVTHQAVAGGIRSDVAGEWEDDPLRPAIRALLKGFGGRQRARKLLLEALVANGLADELARPVDKVMQVIMAYQTQGKAGDAPAVTPLSLYVLTRALMGAVRAAVMEQSPYLGKPEFEDELVRLVRNYLRA